MHRELLQRLPIYSLAASLMLSVVLLVGALPGVTLPRAGLGALGLLPLAAALVDAIRLRHRIDEDQDEANSDAQRQHDRSELAQWVRDKAELLSARERSINSRALALQQWLQFPDAISFDTSVSPSGRSAATGDRLVFDPMARHDRQLFELIERNTQQLFEDIKQDAYRKDVDGTRVFDNEKIFSDLHQMVSDVARIYRPGETSPLLRTNVEAISRATGRAALRLLVAVENIPGGLARHDFQSIYTLISRAVRTYGVYKSAKPYLDVASNMWFAGRIVSSTNPITLVAWWAASRATSYGASKLSGHVIDQQAVGLIRQVVEIVAIEVASLYSPMVRYRDMHWIYGVELVHLASEMGLPPAARLAAMKQIASLSLRDEYGRVSLMRHLAGGTTPRPNDYHPARAVSAAERMTVAERLEAFLLENVLKDPKHRVEKSVVERWQAAASDRLEIQFRATAVDATAEEQTERAVWALASFALQYLGDEPEQVVDRLHLSKCWNRADTNTRNAWIRHLKEDPPYLYHPPLIEPAGKLRDDFLTDLLDLAVASPIPAEDLQSDRASGRQSVTLQAWQGHDAIQVTAYFLRADVGEYLNRFTRLKVERLMAQSDPSVTMTPSPEVTLALDHLCGNGRLHGCFGDATLRESDSGVEHGEIYVARIDDLLIAFDAKAIPDSTVRLTIHATAAIADVKIEKLAGYIRSDCRVEFPSGAIVVVPGSTLRGYDVYFASLLVKHL
ncbi:hypothetical protein FYK55_08735 [Roseiconus nitratireducens]|uniref:Uncharacterized protein n=1 Tax=Roseiconus nitratireducens TaxID=2605748 RepID=A0A5M6DA45_9BACT|nr:hypothetical protein [Roseiconus nitratireducens]KAA5544411.1 hypothetical protein FYK55_08735 [Roseiconus nitratireducens]